MPRCGGMCASTYLAARAGAGAQRNRGAQEFWSTAMTRYSRSVIPGRPYGETANPSDIDRLVFGRKAASNAEDDIPEVEVSELVDRAASDRRRGQRRRSDYAPLPGEKDKYRQPPDNKRGPLLLIGAVVIVGVFGVVVWNAYRDGVRPEDSAVAPPIITPSGAFKSKPPSAAEDEPVEQASVFEQVEGPKVAASSTPEVRSESVETQPEQPAAAPPKPAVSAPSAPVQTAAVSPTAPAANSQASAAPASVKVEGPVALAPQPVESKPVAAELAGGFKPAFSKGGKYVVQIAAPSTEAAALSEWDKRAKASPELFSAAERLVVQADVNGRTVYRLRAGAFATGADADAFCAAYQSKGGACFKTTR